MRSRNGNVIYFAVAGAVLLLTVLVVFISGLGNAALERELAETTAKISTLENQIATAQTSLSQQQSAIVSNVTGVDAARVAADNALAEAFIERVTTWSSSDEYNAVRAEIMEKYHLNEGDRFMKIFLPKYPTMVDNAGNEYNEIDMKSANCHYSGMKPMLSGFVGDKYSYFTIVTATGSTGGASASFNFAMTYTIDGLGNFTGIDGYRLSW